MCMLTHCPECKGPLHDGQQKYPDGIYATRYCKHCGFKLEEPIKH